MSAIERLGLSKELVNRLDARYSFEQSQTSEAFEFKWSKRNTYESEAVSNAGSKWLLERYFDNDPMKLKEFLNKDGSRKIILDAGCGAGYSALLLFGEELKKHDYLGIDISGSVNDGKERFAGKGIKADFIRTNITELDFIPEESIDIIFSEGVLHHTDSTENTLKYLSGKIKKGGYFMFYVYLKKSYVREFTDDFVRQYLSKMSNQEAWNKLVPLTKLGKSLGELDIEIEIEEDVEVLGIKKGKMNLQRFFYWNICKAFYRPDYTLDEMNHINFDWFRPLNCHRQTPGQVVDWCSQAGLNIVHKNIQEAGITIIAQKT